MSEEYNYPYLDPMPKRKPMTNAERIRSMSDEELAEILLRMWTAKKNGLCVAQANTRIVASATANALTVDLHGSVSQRWRNQNETD